MRSAISKFLAIAMIAIFLGNFASSSARAALSGCPTEWKLTDSSFPINRTSEFYLTQQQRRATMQVNLASVAFTFNGTQFVTVPSAQRVSNLQDVTPVQLAIDKSFSLLLSGQQIKVSYDVIAGGCPNPGHFTFTGKIQPATVSRTSFSSYIGATKSTIDPATGGALAETNYFKTPLLLQTAAADLAKCQNQIVAAASVLEKKGSKQSAHFGGSCSLAGGTWRGVVLLQETPNCLTIQPDTGIAGNYYSLTSGRKCKVALARVLDLGAPSSQTFGPSNIYIFSEFTLPGKAIPVPAVSQPSTKKPASTPSKAATPSKNVKVICTNGSKTISVSGSCPSGFHRK